MKAERGNGMTAKQARAIMLKRGWQYGGRYEGTNDMGWCIELSFKRIGMRDDHFCDAYLEVRYTLSGDVSRLSAIRSAWAVAVEATKGTGDGFCAGVKPERSQRDAQDS